jgi:dTDP-glucose pyrophosphorylase
MKAVILAGGLGTRLSEETHLKPKPMVEVGGKPILWHILKTCRHAITLSTIRQMVARWEIEQSMRAINTELWVKTLPLDNAP